MNKNIDKLFWDNETTTNTLKTYLINNLIVAGTSDTVIGLLANTTERGYLHLNDMKNRAQNPYIILIAHPEKLELFVDLPVNSSVQKIITHCWPGPLTLVLKARESLPSYLKSPNGTIALRVPSHKGLQNLLRHFSGLFSTSANLSGQPVAQTIEDLDSRILTHVVCTVKDHQPPKIAALPSTIIDASSTQLRLLREGAYTQTELEKICNNHIVT